MPNVSAKMVKTLREKTGVGMMDCKRALLETDGDVEAAVDWLRKKGIASAAKKSGRVASEGLIGIAINGGNGAIVEINAETDFVARNEVFQGFVSKVAETALGESGGGIEALQQASLGEGRTIAETLTELVTTIGENLGLRRERVLRVEPGIVASYIHNAIASNLGKIGVLVALESTGDAEKLRRLGKTLAMHIAAANPQAITLDGLDADALSREREILSEQARQSGKPEEIIAKMVEGRLRKYYEEVVLLEQTFVVDGETKVANLIEEAAKDIGAPVRVAGFIRFMLGEGVERKESDFASEVAAQLGN